MRLAKASLSILALSLLALTLAAGTATADPVGPSIEFAGESRSPDSLTFNATINPNGSATEYWVNYFKIVESEQCGDPAPGDLANLHSTPHQMISDLLTEDHPASVTVEGLPHETDYCYSWNAQNADGSNFRPYWWNGTTSIKPEVANWSFSAGASSSIDFTVDLTPNSNVYSISLLIEYFVKDGESCDDFTGTPEQQSFYDENWDGWLGFSPVTVSDSLDDLTSGTTYCVRALGDGAYGPTDPAPAWSEVRTIAKQAASVSDISLDPPGDEAPVGTDAELYFEVDDNGAAADAGSNSQMSVYVTDLDPARCNDSEYAGGDDVLSDTASFEGETPMTYEMTGLTLGEDYCVTVTIDSAWGDAFDEQVHVSQRFGRAATVVIGAPTVTTDSIALSGASVDPGHLETDYVFEYFAKQPAVACEADSTTPRTLVGEQTISSDLGQAHPVGITINGLATATTYCVRLLAENHWGGEGSAFSLVTTAAPAAIDPPVTQPVAPQPKQCFVAYSKRVAGRIKKGKKSKKFSVKITATPSADGQSIRLKLATSGAKAAIFAGRRKLGSSATVGDAAGLSVTYKVGRKTRSLKLAIVKQAC